MALPKELAEKLNPVMMKDPCHITFIAALKRLFDARNFKDLTNSQSYNILENLSKQTRYEEKSDIFLNPKCRDLSKTNKIRIFKEYYEYVQPKILQIINNYKSSFYCQTCYTKSNEDSGLFEAISTREYNYKDGDSTCDKFESIDNISSNKKILCEDFNESRFEFDVHPVNSGFILVFNNEFNIFEKGYALRVKDFKPIMRLWFKHVFSAKMPNVDTSTKLANYSCDISGGNDIDIKVEKHDMFYAIAKLRKDANEIEKALEKITSKAINQFSTVVGQERKIHNWIKAKGFNMPAHEFLREYYPDSNPIDVLEMALREDKYEEAFERVQKDAEVGRVDLSSL